MQQACFSAQHLRPCWQQPSFFEAVQQAAFLEQQASLAWQQSRFKAAPSVGAAPSGAVAASPKASPNNKTEPLANALNMKYSPKLERAVKKLAE